MADYSRDEPIASVTVDSEGRLHVKPASSRFDMIYRAGRGVSWDDASGTLIGGVPRSWSQADWFSQILRAVSSEYGIDLRIVPETLLANLPAEICDEMIRFSNS